MNRGSSDSVNLTYDIVLGRWWFLTPNSVYWDNPRIKKFEKVSKYVEKKEKIQSSVVGLIVLVRSLPRYTIVKTQGWWEEPAHVGQHWVRQKP